MDPPKEVEMTPSYEDCEDQKGDDWGENEEQKGDDWGEDWGLDSES